MGNHVSLKDVSEIKGLFREIKQGAREKRQGGEQNQGGSHIRLFQEKYT
jgi:hypothetical protein